MFPAATAFQGYERLKKHRKALGGFQTQSTGVEKKKD